MTYTLPIMMRDVSGFDPEKSLEFFAKSDVPYYPQPHSYFAVTAKQALKNVLKNLSLQRDDIITILTTSDDVYVSSCVTLTCFNFCGISRKIHNNTKLVIVIHEHGYIYPDIEGLCTRMKERGVPVLEDCAHIMGAAQSGAPPLCGAHGDYVLFSLPKILPVYFGGLVMTHASLPSFDAGEQAHDIFKNVARPYQKAVQHLCAINQSRLKNSQSIYQLFNQDSDENIRGAIPYFARICIKDYGQSSTSEIEFGATLRDDLLLVPTNPLVSSDVFRFLQRS
jgi:hypothetical protein